MPAHPIETAELINRKGRGERRLLIGAQAGDAAKMFDEWGSTCGFRLKRTVCSK